MHSLDGSLKDQGSRCAQALCREALVTWSWAERMQEDGALWLLPFLERTAVDSLICVQLEQWLFTSLLGTVSLLAVVCGSHACNLRRLSNLHVLGDCTPGGSLKSEVLDVCSKLFLRKKLGFWLPSWSEVAQLGSELRWDCVSTSPTCFHMGFSLVCLMCRSHLASFCISFRELFHM